MLSCIFLDSFLVISILYIIYHYNHYFVVFSYGTTVMCIHKSTHALGYTNLGCVCSNKRQSVIACVCFFFSDAE